MSSKIALRLTAALIFGAVFACTPALAQQGSPASQPLGRGDTTQFNGSTPHAPGGATLQPAQYWRWGARRWRGRNYYDFAPGAVYDFWAPAGNNVAWCEENFRSYNPATGMYLGYDGSYHSCP